MTVMDTSLKIGDGGLAAQGQSEHILNGSPSVLAPHLWGQEKNICQIASLEWEPYMIML